MWGQKAGPPATGAAGHWRVHRGLTLCLGHLREKLSSVSKQPVRRGQGCVRGHPALRVGGMQCPPGPRPPTSHSACVEGSAEARQACDTCQCCWHSGHHHPVKPASPPLTLELRAPHSAGSECPGPVPHPRGQAHLCRWHTHSGRCGDTPSGSSPRWLPLAGSSSTSVHTPGNSEQGRRDVERQRDPVKA